ncbi:P-loop NTPase fold protein [Bosea sp. NPDC003192]|uniref:P-loop NTPase fold protein n=1 Tax=Bosea sp. NPDC003192 TaxID=3390551 RepID=UPI003CFF0EAE
MAAWQSLLENPIPSEGADTGIRPLRRLATISGFHADRASTAGSDPLGIQADVTAFARLICLEEARPPLSIGIFGEWGSGKSSFMERLQLEIADLTRKEREARVKATQPNAAVSSGNAANAPRFIENAVQIRFNAWHYADANLWASLTAEFFDQLRRGGYEGQRSRDYLALIGKVAERVRSLEASAQKAEDKLADAERTARNADEALASARKKLAASDLALASQHLAETLDGIRKEKQNADKLKEVGRRIYRDDLGTDLDSFTAAVSGASTIPGKVALVVRLMAGGGLPTWLGAFAIVLIAAAGIGWRLGDPTSLAVLLQRAIAWGGGTLAALGSLWQAVKLAKPVLDGAWEYAKAVEKARKELAKEVEDKEVAAREAGRALAEAQQKAKEAKAPLAKYGDGAAAGAPSTILRYFLFEDGDVRDYDKQVGLVSRARRSFEQLDAIFGAKRDGLAAKEKLAGLAPGKTLDPKEVEALKRYEAMQLDKQGLVIPDRIVLYIDDLDRCTHQQVYDVLQAIHLLLAFELFVVVVGVDVRWVEEAVARQFSTAAEDLPDNATPEQRDAARQRAETERRKRAIDYLEKIFQLPFWLRRLSTEGDKGGSYGAYVQELLRANLDVPENVPSPLAGTSGGPVLKTFAPGATPESETSPTDELAPESLTDAAPTADELASVELALATVRLTKEEVDFLASPEIGAIAFKSPRSVKRMLNVYRIVRARMSETELDEFLGRNGKVPNWPVAVFMAAVETGQPVEIADAWFEGLKTGNGEILTASGPTVHASKETAFAEMAKATGLAKLELADFVAEFALSRAIRALDRIEDIGPLTTGRMLGMARIVRRYSFNRYH